jgi:hypothetical protein
MEPGKGSDGSLGALAPVKGRVFDASVGGLVFAITNFKKLFIQLRRTAAARR